MAATNSARSNDVESGIQVDEFHRSNNPFSKFGLLMWKNSILHCRHKWQTIIQILLPFLICSILIPIRSLVETVNYPNATRHPPFEISNMNALKNADHDIHIKEWKLVYSPKNEALDELMSEVVAALEHVTGFEGVKTHEEVESVMIERELICGIVFDHPEDTPSTMLPPYLRFALRFPSETRIIDDPINYNWHTNQLYPQHTTGGPNQSHSMHDGGMPFYYGEAFLAIQDQISRVFIKISCTEYADCEYKQDIPEIRIQQFPYPKYIHDKLLYCLEMVISLFIMLGFVHPMIVTVQFIVVEKEKQLKDVMSIMGMPVWLHGISWLFSAMIFLIISINLVTVVLTMKIFDSVTVILPNSDLFAVWLFLFVYICTIPIYCIFMSAFFAKASAATSMAGLIWFISYTPFIFLAINNVQVPYVLSIVLCILPNVAMAYGCRLIVELERMGDGLHFFNVFDTTASESGLSVGIVGCLMLVTSIVLIFATFCIERVFNKSTNGSTKNNKEESSDEEPAKLEPKYFERNIYDYEPGVQLINLRKEFENDIVICNDLTFEMYRDQVTVLLGHDGCGKSTAIKMLTGMIQPTSGTAIINGFDINTDRVEARQSIGICPQHNFLLDELTAGEHIEFFCRLKGLSRSDVKNEVKKYVELLKLESIINKRADELSRGMKRKIAFCIALCGGSTVIVCDELTNGAGMDPLAKRELWNALESEKIGRTIILTTQFVDEADVLGDRIAIMANGEFKCGGSPFFLKKRFSDGYRLTCVKEDGCDSSKITKILKKHIPDIEIHKEVATEVSYILPYNEMGHFEKICTLLENGLKQLKLFNYGVSSPELDEVFLKLGSDKTNEKPILVDDDTVYEKYDAAFGCSLYFYQCLAMLKKRYYCWITNFKLFAILHHIPMLFIGMSIFFYRNASSYYTLPYLNITLDPYSETVTMLQWDDSINEQIKIIFESYRMETDEKAGETLDEFSENIEERFLEWVKSVEIRSNKRNLIGLSSDNVVLTAFYNGQIFHAAPLALNRLYNAIMKAKLGECALGISVANWPLPFRNQSKLIQTSKDSNIANQMATNTSFAMAFVMAFYVIFYIRERISKTKILQFVVGVNKAIFWTSSLVFDIFLHLITSVIFCATVAVFREKYWSTTEELTILFIVLTLFGLSTLAIVRVASFIFKHDSLGFVGLAVFFIITGVCPYQLIAVLRSSPVNLAQVADILEGFFLLFPHYAMSYSLLNMNRYQIQAETQHVNSSDISIYDWSEPGIGRSLTYMTIVTIVLFSILLVNEFRLVQHALYYAHGLHKKELPTIETTDRINPDVQAEKNKVNEISMADYSIVLQNLTKFYGNVPAVKDLCLAIERGECFGLLGMNGAGKTSTFRMLTGGTSISSGDVFVTGLNLKSHKLQAGYCPEYNALLEDLKGKQILEIFALLHGIRPGDISKRISELADDLNFKKHMNERIKRYKSGDKRKLQTAIALIGTPPAIYLDAPSSGIDPASKRNLWSVISKVRRSGASIMLTTHSLEECEALCTRLAIMVKGELKCLGSAQYLKNRFRKGYLLQIKISPQTKPRMTKLDPETTMLQLVNFINRNFPDATLERKNHGLWTYFIPQTKKRQPSFMFGIMERARSTLGITDYSLTQTTIEQVFLSFGESSA